MKGLIRKEYLFLSTFFNNHHKMNCLSHRLINTRSYYFHHCRISFLNNPPMAFYRTIQLILFALLVFLNDVSAQWFKPRYAFGLQAGLNLYQGDLTTQRMGSWPSKKLATAFHASRIIDPSWSLRGQLFLSGLKGSDSYYSDPAFRQQRNFNFSSPLMELSVLGEWNPLKRNYQEKGLVPYFFTGFGLSRLKVKRDWSALNAGYFSEAPAFWAGLAADTSSDTPSIIPVVPVGAGLKYFFRPNLAVSVESSYRFTGSDLIDGFSRAANPEKNDHYINHSIGIIYRRAVSDRLKCPVIRY
jgi:hypothetical protein